jgi:hypothetical protein
MVISILHFRPKNVYDYLKITGVRPTFDVVGVCDIEWCSFLSVFCIIDMWWGFPTAENLNLDQNKYTIDV